VRRVGIVVDVGHDVREVGQIVRIVGEDEEKMPAVMLLSGLRWHATDEVASHAVSLCAL
jgi:hypothetical protein